MDRAAVRSREPPSHLSRKAMISPRIEIAVSSGVAAEVEAADRVDGGEVVLADPLIAQPRAPV